MILHQVNSHTPAAEYLRGLISAWLLAVTAEYLLLPGDTRALAGLEGLSRMSPVRVLALTAGIFLVLRLLSLRFPGSPVWRWLLAGTFLPLSAASLVASFSWPFLGGCVLILGILAVYGFRGWNASAEKLPTPRKKEPGGRLWLWVTVGLTAAFFLFVSLWTVCRVKSFSTPTYDFGIFAQMFHNMKTTGLPVTTLERDGALSHFRVHMSPIYYLLLPIYCLVPRPETLQVLQAAVLASAVIPLWKLGKLHGLTPAQRTLVCGMLLLFPGMAGGASYDIHENCFLAPLLLWLFYGIDRKNPRIIAPAAVLTLMVKEDAAVYVAVIGLWLAVRTLLRHRREGRGALITGCLLLTGAVVWFLGVTAYLARVGDGVMTYRYNNFLYGGSGSLLTVVLAVLMCPMKALYECLEPEKLSYIGLTLLPLLGLPLLTRRFERYLLLIPYILVNLMSDYPYQHSIFFQYGFGSAACLLYLAVVNLRDLRHTRQWLAAAAVCVSALCFCLNVVPRAAYYPARYFDNRQAWIQLQETLAQIPEEASVSATGFYTTFLSDRETLYDVRYCSREHLLGSEYVALNVNGESEFRKYASETRSGYDRLVEILEQNGYTVFAEIPGTMVIYHKS